MLCASASASEPAAEALSIVAKHKAVFAKPPEKIPSRMHPHDAPILGNGDLVAAMAGGPEYPQFWLTTNDFWEFREPDRGGAPKSLGRLIFETPSLAGASYRVEQDFATATTAGRFAGEDRILSLRAWVAATENVLLVELAAEGQPVEVTMSFRFPEQPGLGASPIAWASKEPYVRKASEPAPVQEHGWTNGLLWAVRTFDKSVWQPTRLAMAARVLDTETADGRFTVAPAKPVTIVVALRSWEKTTQPLENATRRAERFAADDLHLLRALHERWWRDYWGKSLIALDDQAIEQAYYRSFYDPEEIWQVLKYRLNYSHPSGFIWQGIESLMFYPNTLQEMMLLSHENVLRFFRAWPRQSQPNARFCNLWAHGAFRCSATLRDGMVAEVRIVSRKGRDCTIENPWPGRPITLVRNGRKGETLTGERITFATAVGETVEIRDESTGD
jgi:hypothetical protein